MANVFIDHTPPAPRGGTLDDRANWQTFLDNISDAGTGVSGGNTTYNRIVCQTNAVWKFYSSLPNADRGPAKQRGSLLFWPPGGTGYPRRKYLWLDGNNATFDFTNRPNGESINGGSMFFHSCKEIVIEDCNFIGTRRAPNPPVGQVEHRHLVHLSDCEDVRISNCDLRENRGGGDCIYFGGGRVNRGATRRVLVEDSNLMNGSRNVISHCNDDSVTFYNCTIRQTAATLTLHLVDFEAVDGQFSDNITYDHCTFGEHPDLDIGSPYGDGGTSHALLSGVSDPITGLTIIDCEVTLNTSPFFISLMSGTQKTNQFGHGHREILIKRNRLIQPTGGPTGQQGRFFNGNNVEKLTIEDNVIYFQGAGQQAVHLERTTEVTSPLTTIVRNNHFIGASDAVWAGRRAPGSTWDLEAIGIESNNLLSGTPPEPEPGGTPTQVEFSSPLPDVETGEPLQNVEVKVLDVNGDLVPTATNSVTVALGTKPVGAVLSGTKVKNAVAGVVNYDNLSVDLVGAYTLVATASGLTLDTSTSFDASATPPPPSGGTPTQLAFGSVIADTVVDTTLVNVSVEVRDSDGVLVPTATNQVTVALGTKPTGAVLTGTLTRVAVNGVAVFNNLKVDLVGAYTLVATASGLTQDASAFDATAEPTEPPPPPDPDLKRLLLSGTLGVGNFAAATAPGIVIGKWQLLDDEGRSVGYVPIYDDIE